MNRIFLINQIKTLMCYDWLNLTIFRFYFKLKKGKCEIFSFPYVSISSPFSVFFLICTYSKLLHIRSLLPNRRKMNLFFFSSLFLKIFSFLPMLSCIRIYDCHCNTPLRPFFFFFLYPPLFIFILWSPFLCFPSMVVISNFWNVVFK